MHAAQWIEEFAFRDDIVNYVTNLCRRYRIKRPDVDDLVQEVLTAIVASVAKYQPEKGAFDKWARGIARNIIYRYLRDKTRYAAMFCEVHPNVDEYAAPESSPESSMQATQARRRLSSAANCLTEKQAEILMLHVVDDMSHKDIATKLKTTEEASQKCYQRARNRMAQCIAGEARCVMPTVETSCNAISVPNDATSQWFDPSKWSHYSGQIAAAIIAFLMFVPSNSAMQARASITGKIPTAGGIAMYQRDKQFCTSDKLVVSPNVPMGKLEPATLPSVHVVPARTKFVGKPTPVQPSVPEPSFTPTVRPVGHRRPTKMQ